MSEKPELASELAFAAPGNWLGGIEDAQVSGNRLSYESGTRGPRRRSHAGSTPGVMVER
jgi:hypothetical protein